LPIIFRPYHILGNVFKDTRKAGKFGEFGESSVICQTKIIQISTYNYNILAESIHSPKFFCHMLKASKFAKLSCYTVHIFVDFKVFIQPQKFVPQIEVLTAKIGHLKNLYMKYLRENLIHTSKMIFA